MKPTLFQRALGVIGLQTKSSLSAAFLRGDDGTEAGGAHLVSAWQQSVWVYSAVNLVARTLAGIPFRVWRGPERGGKLVETGAVVDLFERPHPQLSRFDFTETLVINLLLRGRAYVVGTDRNGSLVDIAGPRPKKPAFLLVLPADRVTLHVQAGELLGYRFSRGHDSPVRDSYLLPEEVIALRLPTPFDFYEGQAPAHVAAVAAQTDYAAAKFMQGLMLNNADTGVIVETDQQPDDNQRQQILAALRERKRKAGTADRPLLLWGGFKVVKPALSSTDMQFLENRKFARQEICAVFGVPQELLGFTEDANRSVGESARANFIEHTVCPLAERIAAALRPLVKAFGNDLDCWFDTDAHPSMQAQRRARFAAAGQAQLMGIPLATLNDTFDLGLPENLPGDKDALRPFSVEVVGSLGEAAAPVLDAEVVEENAFTRLAARLQQGARSTEQGTATAPLAPGSQLRAPGSQTCAAPAGYERAIAGSIKRKQSRLGRFFYDQRGRVLRRLESALTRQSAIANQKSVADDLWDDNEEDDALKSALRPLLIADLEFGGAQVWNEIAAGIDFQLPPANATAFLAQRAKEIVGINETTFEGIREAVRAGLEAGESYEQVAARIRTVFNEAGDSRAETIAITETNVAVNAGRFAAMEQARVPLKGWLSARLETSRATHLQAERDYGQEADAIPTAQPFIVGGEALMHPGDPNGSPGNTIRCRCVSIAVLESEERGAGSGDPVRRRCVPATWLSYEAWTKSRQDAPGSVRGTEDRTRDLQSAAQAVSDVLQGGLKAPATPAPGSPLPAPRSQP